MHLVKLNYKFMPCISNFHPFPICKMITRKSPLLNEKNKSEPVLLLQQERGTEIRHKIDSKLRRGTLVIWTPSHAHLFWRCPPPAKSRAFPQLQEMWTRNSTHAFLKEYLCLRLPDFFIFFLSLFFNFGHLFSLYIKQRNTVRKSG